MITHDQIATTLQEEFDRLAQAGEIKTAKKAKTVLHRMANSFRKLYVGVYGTDRVPRASMCREWFLLYLMEVQTLDPSELAGFTDQMVKDIDEYFTIFAQEIAKPLRGLPSGDPL